MALDNNPTQLEVVQEVRRLNEAKANKTSIPTVNDGKLTISVTNGQTTNTVEFTANQSGNKMLDISADSIGVSLTLTIIGYSESVSEGDDDDEIEIYSSPSGGTGVFHIARVGEVVIKNSVGKQFVWNGNIWTEVMDNSPYMLKNNAITGATKCKITYDSKGLVTAGADLGSSDIPSLDAAKITSGTFADARIASAATWNGKYTKPSGGIPASDLAESYYLASNPNGYISSVDWKTIYPVGAVYLSTSNTSPSTFIPNTTWVALDSTSTTPTTLYMWTNYRAAVYTNERHVGNRRKSLSFDWFDAGNSSHTPEACAHQSNQWALTSRGDDMTITQLNGSSWGSNWDGGGNILPNNLWAEPSYLTVYAWRRLS